MPLDPEACRVLDAKRAEGRGVIFVTAHLGPIDIMAASVAEHGYPAATLARESYDPRFTALVESLRAPRGVQTIYRGRQGMESAIIRALRRGMLVGFPMDLAGRGMETRQVPFLGEPTPIPVGPARLARRLGVPVVVGTPAPAAGGMTITVEPLDSDANGSDESLVLAMAGALERRIRALPAHWPWMHGA
jgi:KDO2-lipid IV(A) lauroyltransferase